ncbi:MAG: hypothetical protein K2O41_01100 [Clostridia bacterium]|nr:hypothetical protein [Clostridia bacterium]
MKKIFKALAVLAATTAIGAGIGMAAGCSKGYDGVYYGDYHYTNEHGATYGMKVKVTVENNIIVKVEDVTKGAYTVVSEAMPDYGWDADSVKNWTDNESWLLQQYEGLAVSDVKAIKVNIKETGEPYSKDKNAGLNENGILITNSTQGSGRLLLAVQNALGENKEIGRIEKAN